MIWSLSLRFSETEQIVTNQYCRKIKFILDLEPVKCKIMEMARICQICIQFKIFNVRESSDTLSASRHKIGKNQSKIKHKKSHCRGYLATTIF